MAKRNGENVSNQRKFVKLSGRDHVLQRSDMYCGSVSPGLRSCFVCSSDSGAMELREVSVAPAFLQVFEEVVMNAADRVSADSGDIDKKTTLIQVVVCRESGKISVTNNGDGIPTNFDEEHGCHTPELVFGHLRTSSNYDDSNERLNVGRNGIGVKIVNIFSSRFVVETVDAANAKKYRQRFTDNMSKIHDPSLRDFSGEPYTRVTFDLDFERFGMDGISDDVMSIMRKRCHEVCLCSPDKIKVTFNSKNLKTDSIEKYMQLYGIEKKAIASATNDRWKAGLAFSPDVGSFRHMSFVNSTCTPDGGTHVSYVMDSFMKQAMPLLRKKVKSAKLKPSVVRDVLTLVVSAHVVNPTFSSQTKDNLTLPPKDFGSTFEVPEVMVTRVLRSGLTEYVTAYVKTKERDVMNESDGRKVSRIKGLPNLHDAKFAGTRKSSECLLVLTEGLSAMTMALSAMSVIGRDKFGAFPLRGKLLNVRDASPTQMTSNAEITAIKKIIGLQNGVAYKDASSLRYGGIIILTDADTDGSHIRGLVINLFDVHWPSLLDIGFIKSIDTPIVKATRGAEVRLFYNDFEYRQWKESVGERGVKLFKLKYLKGLGSSTAEEARKYFRDIQGSLITYTKDAEAGENMSLAFCKKRAGDRKKWLSSYDNSHIVDSSAREVNISTFVNNELIHFSRDDLLRSIPSVVDGLKVSQRKALYGSLMRGLLTTEAKVAQLTGYVSSRTAYRHGESSMSGTLVAMAQDFVGANNLNLLLPKGQFGSRLSGGSDAASDRYIYVQLSPVTPLLFPDEDHCVLDYTDDEGVKTEPVHYSPVISTLLVNGSKAIATGYSTSIPKFNPLDVIANVRRRLSGQPPIALKPFYRGFTGDITTDSHGSFITHGVFRAEGETVTITDLPVGVWSSNYKAFLEGLLEKKEIVNYSETCTDVDVNFVVTLSEVLPSSGVERFLKLTSSLKMTNLHAFDSRGHIQLYENAGEIEEAHFVSRAETYKKRRAHLVGVLEHETTLLSEKARFMGLRMKGEITIDNTGVEDIMKSIENRGFKRLPATLGSDSATFDYITAIKLFDSTAENLQRLETRLGAKTTELRKMRESTVEQLWLSDLDALEKAILAPK